MNMAVADGTMAEQARMTDGGSRLAALLGQASIEVTPHDPNVADEIRALYPAGMAVHVTFLPGGDVDMMIETCARLHRNGYRPTPHLTARNFPDRASLERVMAALRERAEVSRALVLAGDVDRPRGPLATSIDLMKTGTLETHAVHELLIAGHPEGHPHADADTLLAALKEKIAYARAHGHAVEIVTQFSFDAQPVLAWLKSIRAAGVDAPVRIGLAGPAKTTTLIKFAARCGIGNSVRTLMRRPSAIAGLLTTTSPDDVLQDLAAGLGPEHGAIAGIHLFLFGGLKSTAKWLEAARSKAANSSEGNPS